MRKVFFGFAFVPFLAVAACVATPQENESALQPSKAVAEQPPVKLTPPDRIDRLWTACDEILERQGKELALMAGLQLRSSGQEVVCRRQKHLPGGSGAELVVLVLKGDKFFQSPFAMSVHANRALYDRDLDVRFVITASREIAFRPPVSQEMCILNCSRTFHSPVYFISKRTESGLLWSPEVAFSGFRVRFGRDFYFIVPVLRSNNGLPVTEDMAVLKFTDVLQTFSLYGDAVSSETAWLSRPLN